MLVADDGTDDGVVDLRGLQVPVNDYPFDLLGPDNRRALETLVKAYGLDKFAVLCVAITDLYFGAEVNQHVRFIDDGTPADQMEEGVVAQEPAPYPHRIWRRVRALAVHYQIDHGQVLNLAVSECYDRKIANLRDAEG